MNNYGKVFSVNISEKKGTVKTPVKQIILNKSGIRNDAHAGTYLRQISILGIEKITEFSNLYNKKIKPGEFAENITSEGIDFSKASVLDRLKIGRAFLEITQIGKECHGSECNIFKQVGSCIMPKEGIFCRVIKPGCITKKSKIIYIPKILLIKIITLSDRASKGIYEDKSGPEIQNSINNNLKNIPWGIKFINKIIPDDKKQLKAQIKNALRKKVDIIFTTGGTGIGSRDITPDVIEPMFDKKLPGIMEFIRNKYGDKIPNSLLSRSNAGIINKTIIFCLPGSVKAIIEYISEIIKILEHSIYMINDLNIHN